MSSWLQPPRLRTGEESEQEHRHATWLELFYDLVFVVAVSQVAHNLYADVSITGFLSFGFLFIPIWWAWIGTTFYSNRFDSDDIGHRLLLGVQMLAIAALAVNVHDGLGESSAGFAIAYAAGRAVLVLEYFRAAKHIPQARGLATRYGTGFAIAAILWLISVFIPTPWRFILWGLGLFVDFATPLTAPKSLHLGLLPHPEHLPERFGLFTIIVLGEAIIAVVDGVAEQKWNVTSASCAVLGFIIAFSLWWIYFENVSGSALRSAGAGGQIEIFQVWLYGHLPLVIGLSATGVGVEHIIATEAGNALSTPNRWLLCGAVALCLLSLGLLHRTGVIFKCKVRSKYRFGTAALLIILAIVGVGLSPLGVVGIVAFVCATQVVQDLYQSGQLTFQ
ncbi:low temperature requirement protein A [Synechocystis sp. PCC 7509]|uniref:low temperature requirement protein A n=1 Tax=Synechocystis sp. PCC 7509 TaxID=927677 RepID=UPI0002AC42F6|nr:low temperature requirement protein A [Synechocystis sp. PCC 7509]